MLYASPTVARQETLAHRDRTGLMIPPPEAMMWQVDYRALPTADRADAEVQRTRSSRTPRSNGIKRRALV